MQFVEPSADSTPLPHEVAHGARALTHGAVLALIDQRGVTKMRVRWQCGEHDLVIEVRDDGPGVLPRAGPRVDPLQQRVRALGGSFGFSSTPGWGSAFSVSIPLSLPPAAGDGAQLGRLTPREREVLQILAAGRRNRDIAEQLGISENTVKFHVSRILRKLGARSRGEAAARARALGVER